MLNALIMLLDVGCGVCGKGDVNCDLFVLDVDHHRTKTNTKENFKINSRETRNFVQCDSCYLPFKTNSFEVVYSAHVIEHVLKPVSMVKEMLRVASQKVVIKCPHRFGNKTFDKWCKEKHINNFNFKWFGELAKYLGVDFELKESYTKYIPSYHFHFIKFPLEITFILYVSSRTF